MKHPRVEGIRAFAVIWFGQLVSVLGTGATRFALVIWAYQQSDSATTLALLGFFSLFPYVLLSPIAGGVVDRFDRKKIMIVADLCAGIVTAALLGLYLTDNLSIHHLYLAEALSGAFEAFQIPAYSAAITLLVPKEHYGRVSGMRSLSDSASTVFAPILAGAMVVVLGIGGVMLVDLSTFLVAVASLVLVRIPKPSPAKIAQPGAGHFWGDVSFGFRYILSRPGFLGLILVMAVINLFAGITYYGALSTMVLRRTGGSEIALATVQSVLGAGGIAGGLLMSVWGGPRRRIDGVLTGAGLSFLLGDSLFAVGRSVPVWAVGAFLGAVFVPFIIGAQAAIWQSKVEPAVQGRVFAVKGMVQPMTMALGYLLAGPLADRLFEPAMSEGGALASTFGWLVGTGPGAGIGLMFACTCILGTLMSFLGYVVRPVRCIEDDYRDYDEVTTEPNAELSAERGTVPVNGSSSIAAPGELEA